jgi:trehalose 6-phosphate phosphatase
VTVTDALRPLTEAPERAAILLDVDGTLAPIVERADDAMVPDETRELLEELATRYGLVALVSGRGADDARRLVGLPQLTYAGAHGAELLEPGKQVRVLPAFADWADRVHAFAESHDVGARMEDKGPIVAYHWRGLSDGVEHELRRVADQAQREGFITHWGRKVLEIRPGVPVNKGQAVEELAKGMDAVLYAGDDVTDLDAFAAVKRLGGVTVGVESDEGPSEIVQEADVVVDGPAGFVEVLRALR